MRKFFGLLVILGTLSILVVGCDKKPALSFPISDQKVSEVIDDLSKWVKTSDLGKAEAKAWREFCLLLAARRYCDGEMSVGKMKEKEAVEATQPVIDHLAKRGKPTETVLLNLLEARKDLKPEERRKTLCNEDPEIFGAIVLWNMKSKRAIAVFQELAKKQTIVNRAVFVRGLGRIGDPQALDFLRELAASDPNPEIRGMADEAIEAIGGDTKPKKPKAPASTPSKDAKPTSPSAKSAG